MFKMSRVRSRTAIDDSVTSPAQKDKCIMTDFQDDSDNSDNSDDATDTTASLLGEYEDRDLEKGKKKVNVLPPKYSLPAMVGIFTVFMLSGPMLIMSNKYILKDLDFSFPLTLTCMTLIFCAASCWTYVKITGMQMERSKTMTTAFYLKRICPIGALSAGTVVFGMTSYLFLTVAFVQMLKAFTPVMTMMGLVLFRLENPSKQVVMCVLSICIGTAIAGYGELNFSLMGVSCMIIAQMFEALKLIFTQIVLQKNKFSLVETLYYITPTSAACVFFFACIIEFPKMTQEDFAKMANNVKPFFLSCVVAIMTNVINTFVVQSSNALVLKLAVTARNALLVLFHAAFMGEEVTGLEVWGYVVSLSGFLSYNIVKLKEQQKR
eukprot:CAMPEP_0195294946 /NCGR_PEP_ID=MMETSP0707-20130614/16257_1 /TAXON_ID=33640 /ORGANISM="Asterionellopsis glacialis, Strain CCMP134" /LENGTH=377 /DNA_ID=CAMNT_0040356045 /DNA_START=103 /DNA_END=1236 /DNA_ORIENTATION=+